MEKFLGKNDTFWTIWQPLILIDLALSRFLPILGWVVSRDGY
jgi:hypothetical protein